MARDQRVKELQEFIDLTSDKVIREAAYPQEEWIINVGKGNSFLGGSLNSYSIVATQDNPPEINPQGGLLCLYKPESVNQDLEKRAANIAQHWQKIKAHSCYKRFHSYADNRLKYAVDTFEKKTKLKTASEALKSDFAQFRFYHLFAQYIESYLFYDEFGRPQKYADAIILRQAKGHAEKLLEGFREGLRLSNNHYQLEALLKQLLIEINQAPRKDKETPTAAKRRALEAFAFVSVDEFGETSATILGHLAEILGWNNPSNSTMEEIVATAKKKHQTATEKRQTEKAKKLAEALLQPPAIIAKK